MDEERISQLESKLLYQEDHIQALDKAMFTMQQQLNDLCSDYELAKTRLRELEQNQGLDLDPNEMPPHY